MGWKNVKEFYRIGHHVQVTDKGICIGSGYVHDILIVNASGLVRRSKSVGRGEPFDSLVAAFAADPAKLRELVEAPDTFAANIPVFTYTYDGRIVEKQCEVPGWPNVTHDGEMMYDNTHFPNRSGAVERAKAELAAVRNNRKESLEAARREVSRLGIALSEAEAALRRVEC